MALHYDTITPLIVTPLISPLAIAALLRQYCWLPLATSLRLISSPAVIIDTTLFSLASRYAIIAFGWPAAMLPKANIATLMAYAASPLRHYFHYQPLMIIGYW